MSKNLKKLVKEIEKHREIVLGALGTELAEENFHETKEYTYAIWRKEVTEASEFFETGYKQFGEKDD